MNDEKLKSQLGSNIAFYRKRNGLTQAKLAEQLNYSDKAVSKWERGESMPDVLTLVQLAELFEIKVDDLIRDPNEIPVHESGRIEHAMEIAVEKTLKKYLEGFNLNIRDNQTNISYKGLFGDYLEGATEYTIKDPYIRLPYQMRNFVELCRLITELKPEDEEVRIHLVTFNSEEFLEAAKQGFSELGDSLEELGITFTYEFNDVQHDRCIEMNNGWKIILGRGLDIWQKTSGRFDIAEFYQEKRLCKEFEVTVVRG